MAIVRLGEHGEVEVMEPPTPEEIAAAQAGLERVITALAQLARRCEAGDIPAIPEPGLSPRPRAPGSRARRPR